RIHEQLWRRVFDGPPLAIETTPALGLGIDRPRPALGIGGHEYRAELIEARPGNDRTRERTVEGARKGLHAARCCRDGRHGAPFPKRSEEQRQSYAAA